MAESTDAFAIILSHAKSAIFGLLAGIVGCSAGLRTRSTADGVGAVATAAVVGGIVAVAIADGVIAAICNVWGV